MAHVRSALASSESGSAILWAPTLPRSVDVNGDRLVEAAGIELQSESTTKANRVAPALAPWTLGRGERLKYLRVVHEQSSLRMKEQREH